MHSGSEKNLGIFCPLYNGEKFIKRYLDNVVEQTIFNEVNFYILDCASPDGEFRTIEKYLHHDNIKYKRLDKDPGLYPAWNICVDWVQEKYIGNWNVDDRKTDDSLEVLLKELLEDEDLDLIYGITLTTSVVNDSWQETTSKKAFPFLPHSFENLLRNNSPHCMPIWKKDMHKKHGYFDENYLSASDTDMWLRACKGGAKMKLLEKVIGLYYHNPNGRSTNPETLQQMLDEVKKVRSKFL